VYAWVQTPVPQKKKKKKKKKKNGAIDSKDGEVWDSC
jgi:hypothetical protein